MNFLVLGNAKMYKISLLNIVTVFWRSMKKLPVYVKQKYFIFNIMAEIFSLYINNLTALKTKIHYLTFTNYRQHTLTSLLLYNSRSAQR